MIRDLQAHQQEIQAASQRFGLPSDVPVLSCYEYGRENEAFFGRLSWKIKVSKHL
jgi:hypothetical protein